MTALGEFLRDRRARTGPAAAGVVAYGTRRRVPGLRREELAELAGVSPGYYTRLEQGRSRNASAAVLDALAAALRLGGEERAHLHELARLAARGARSREPVHPAPGGARPPGLTGPGPAERPHPRLLALVAAVGLPALLLGRHTDVLAWNARGHALLAPHLDHTARPNWARLFFLDPALRTLFVDWPDKARDTVADLRRVAGRDPGVHGLVAGLRRDSAEFAALWAEHAVRGCGTHTREYRHPVAGPLTLSDDLLSPADGAGQRLVLFSAAPGSPSEVALERLDAPVRGGACSTAKASG